MKSLFFFVGALALGILAWNFSACNKIAPPYKKTQVGSATFPNQRNVLLEEYTGHTCVNCPAAASLVEGFLDSTFRGRIVPVAIHATGLSDPAGYPFNYNFQTPAGNQYATFFGVSIDPSALINRKSYSGNVVLVGSGAWASAIKTFVNDTADANIIISTPVYNASIKQANFSVSVNWLKSVTGNFNLCLEYTEDSIINAQITPTGINKKYVFMHVLRGNLNGDFGQQISSNPTAYSVYSNNYSFTLDSALVAKNCHLVAYVFNNASNEVVQAQQIGLIP